MNKFLIFVSHGLHQIQRKIHEALIKRSCSGTISGHLSRDATAIEAREKPAKKETPIEGKNPPIKKKGRTKKGETPLLKEPTRIQKQLNMSLEEMLKDLPTVCNRGSKRNSQGHVENWNGYKLHIDTGKATVFL
jgi:hypothetical protein